MVEEHRSQTDLSPATAVVLSLHSSKHTLLATRMLLGFSRWRSDALTQDSSSLPQSSRERVWNEAQTSNASKVRKRFLLLELLSVSESWCTRSVLFSGFPTFKGLESVSVTKPRENDLKTCRTHMNHSWWPLTSKILKILFHLCFCHECMSASRRSTYYVFCFSKVL